MVNRFKDGVHIGGANNPCTDVGAACNIVRTGTLGQNNNSYYTNVDSVMMSSSDFPMMLSLSQRILSGDQIMSTPTSSSSTQNHPTKLQQLHNHTNQNSSLLLLHGEGKMMGTITKKRKFGDVNLDLNLSLNETNDEYEDDGHHDGMRRRSRRRKQEEGTSRIMGSSSRSLDLSL